MMKRVIMLAAVLVAVTGCSTTDRYNAVASTCQSYAVALKTAAKLNIEGKLSNLSKARINATIEPAQAVCSGAAPSNDPEAVHKVSALVIAVLESMK